MSEGMQEWATPVQEVVIAMVFIQCVAMSMAELCLAIPTFVDDFLFFFSFFFLLFCLMTSLTVDNGNQRRIALRIGHPCTPGLLDPFAPWITGWSNSIGQVTSSAVGGLNNDPGQREEASTTGDYVPSHWQVYLQTALILFLHTIISSMPTRWIATFNSRGLGGHRPST